MAMAADRRQLVAGLAGLAITPAVRAAIPIAPALTHVFTLLVQVGAPVELGRIDGAQRRFVPITGGRISGPRLAGVVLPGGGDWQDIRPGGLTEVRARYVLKADDGSMIGVENSGVRVASEAVTADLARGVPVEPSAYYFRTVPRFDVAPGPHEWLRRSLFVASGIRRPTEVQIDIFALA